MGLGGANGGDGGAVEAGKAYVKMGVKDDTATGLAKVKGKLATFGEEVGKALGGASAQATEGAGRAGLLAGVALAAREVLVNLTAFVPSLNAAKREMQALEAASRGTGEAVKRITEDFDRVRELARAGGGGRGELGVLDKQIAATAKLLKLKDEEIDAAFKLKLAAGDPSTGRTIIGSGWIGAVTGIDVKKEYDDAVAAYERVAGGRADIDAKLAELKRAREKISDPFKDANFLSTFKGIGTELRDALDPGIQAMGEMEKKVLDLERANTGADAAAKKRIGLLREEARATDEKLKQLAVEKEFGQALAGAWVTKLSDGLSPEDKELARLVEKGFSNDQIMQLRHLQQDLAQNANRAKDFFSRGGLASGSLGRQLGIADSWQRQEKLQELGNEKLDEIRKVVGDLKNKFGFN